MLPSSMFSTRKARENEIRELKEEVAKKESLLCILSHDMSRDTETSQSEVVDCWEDREHLCNDGDGCDSKEKLVVLLLKGIQLTDKHIIIPRKRFAWETEFDFCQTLILFLTDRVGSTEFNDGEISNFEAWI